VEVKKTQAIDVHAHYGKYQRGRSELIDDFCSGDAETVVRRAKAANTRLTFVSPLRALIPRFNNDPVGGNEEAVSIIKHTEGLRQWVVIDPLVPKTYEQADEILKLDQCVGIKIHPEEHGYKITEQGRAIFEFAAARNAIIETHSGEENSMPADFIPFANDFPSVTLIISHLGCGWDNDPSHQVRAIQQSKHGNIYTDTSSAMSINPLLVEWAVKEIGAEKIMYGTDTPLYFSPMQRARVDFAEISDKDKKLILCDNAIKLFNLQET
jgi:predicted TIM-barrel fold metal-dependent hydrolase